MIKAVKKKKAPHSQVKKKSTSTGRSSSSHLPKPWDIGQKAPSFTLRDQDGTPHTLSSAVKNGPVVLIFYPGDMTPGCTLQLCAVRDHQSQFSKVGATVWGINPAGKESHRAFIEKYALTVPLLVDTDLVVAEKYGAIKKLFGHVSVRRSVFVIAPNGKIVFKVRGLPADTEILKAIASISPREQ